MNDGKLVFLAPEPEALEESAVETECVDGVCIMPAAADHEQSLSARPASPHFGPDRD